MTDSWIRECGIILEGRGENICCLGHETHESLTVDIDLSKHLVPDFPKGRGTARYTVYDWKLYHGTPCYCPGNDEVSLSVATQGTWEGYETVLALDIVRRQPGIVIDFGANSGWYSVLLALEGCEVLAVEADEENTRILRKNLELNGIVDKVTVSRGWVGADTPRLESGPQVRFLKSDVEGLEDQIVRVCSNLIEDRLIDYAVLEVSPSFKDHYPATLAYFTGCGYDAFLVPDKGFDVIKYAQNPLGETKNFPLDLSTVPSLRQRSVLLERRS